MMLEPGQQGSSRSMRWNRLSLAIMGAGILSLVGAGVLFALILTGTVDDGYSGPGTTTTFGKIDDEFLTPQPSPTADLPPPSEAPISRISIPRFEVDAPIVVRGVDAGGVMETPDGPTDVAWYDFSARPGFGSNAVFSAHVDYINYGPAVFWNLKDLEEGDLVEVALTDGTVYKYAIVGRQQVSAGVTGEELGRIIGTTEQEIITLITCGGSFDPNVGQYDQRVVVRAERLYDAPLATGASDSP